MTECIDRLYGINQKDAEAKEDLGKDGSSTKNQNRLDCLYHDVKNIIYYYL
jgi:hypothetical protein